MHTYMSVPTTAALHSPGRNGWLPSAVRSKHLDELPTGGSPARWLVWAIKIDKMQATLHYTQDYQGGKIRNFVVNTPSSASPSRRAINSQY